VRRTHANIRLPDALPSFSPPPVHLPSVNVLPLYALQYAQARAWFGSVTRRKRDASARVCQHACETKELSDNGGEPGRNSSGAHWSIESRGGWQTGRDGERRRACLACERETGTPGTAAARVATFALRGARASLCQQPPRKQELCNYRGRVRICVSAFTREKKAGDEPCSVPRQIGTTD